MRLRGHTHADFDACAAMWAEPEVVLKRLGGVLPSTLNLVSGPSRTGDIEQTMELGAHGPKSLAVLVVKN